MRRLLNTKEELGAKNRGGVVDMYAKKLLHSGYSKEQTRKILKNGIKGFEGRRRSRLEKSLPMRSTAKMSSKSRHIRKLLGKTTWYKKKRSPENVKEKRSPSNIKGAAEKLDKEKNMEPQTVLFVEYSKGGELASRMKEFTKRLAQVTGFSVKIVERAGAALRSQFPTTTLWDGNSCGSLKLSFSPFQRATECGKF